MLPPPQYFKEYTCHQFNSQLRPDSKPARTLRLTFAGNSLASKAHRPSYLIDSLAERENLFILKWILKSPSAICLDLFAFQDPDCLRIYFDQKPLLICIVAQHLYVVGGSELQLIDLNTLSIVKNYQLKTEVVYSLEPAYIGPGVGEKGAILYAWSSQEGLTKKSYSPTTGDSTNWLSSAKSLIYRSRNEQLGTIKVLIPNIIGLLIHSNMQDISVVSLTDMKVIHQASFRLEEEQRLSESGEIVVKYQQIFNDEHDSCLMIGISERHSDSIEIIEVSLEYNRERKQQLMRNMEKREQELRIPPLSSFSNGLIVDWARTTLTCLSTTFSEGKIIDFILTETGIIYYADTPSKIPTATFLKYSFPEQLNPILALEHNICKSFLHDCLLKVDFDERDPFVNPSPSATELNNSVLAPNRFSMEFILASSGVESFSKVQAWNLQPRRLLLSWHKSFRPKAILRINNDIVILRENSLSTLLPISRDQYYMEEQPGEQLLQNFKDAEMSSQSDISSISNDSYRFAAFEENDERQQLAAVYRPGFKDSVGAALGMEVIGNSDSRDLLNDHNHRISQLYHHYFRLFNSIIQKDPPRSAGTDQDNLRIENKNLAFAYATTLNRFKDMILFYYRILVRTYPYSLGHSADSQRQKYILILLQFFKQILCSSVYAVADFGEDFLTIFANKNLKLDNNQQWVNVDLEAKNLMNKLFFDLLEEGPGHKVNSFVKELINMSNLSQTELSSASEALLSMFNPNVIGLVPYTRSSLAGVSCANLILAIKKRFISSYVLAKVNETANTNLNLGKVNSDINRLLKQFPCMSELANYFRECLGCAGGRNGYIANPILSMNSQYDSQLIEEQGTGFDGVDDDDIDSESEPTINIWRLLKISDSEDLEQLLLTQTSETIGKIQESVINQMRFLNTGITDDDILGAWVFLYRCHVLRSQQILFGNSEQPPTKGQALKHIRNAKASLVSVGEYYHKAYKTQQRQEDSYLVKVVCSQMIGLSPVLLYQKWVATNELMGLLEVALSSEETDLATFRDFKNLVYFHLSRAFQNNDPQLIKSELMKLTKFASREELSDIISSSRHLQQICQTLPSQIQDLLGYSPLNLMDRGERYNQGRGQEAGSRMVTSRRQ